MVTNEQEELKPCPFCGAGPAMLYRVDGQDFHGFKRPEIFCDACKASVYFEDSTSTGVDDDVDYQNQVATLEAGWESRTAFVNDIMDLTKIKAKMEVYTDLGFKFDDNGNPTFTSEYIDECYAELTAQKAHLTTKGGDHE